MQVQRIGVYNQFYTDKNQQKQTKNPMGFEMKLLIDKKEEEIIKRLVDLDGLEEVKAYVDDLNKPEKMIALFNDCYKEFNSGETNFFTPDICIGFNEASPKLQLLENLNNEIKRLTVFVTEIAEKDRNYVGVGHISIATPVSKETLIDEIKMSFENFAKQRIEFDTFFKNKKELS